MRTVLAELMLVLAACAVVPPYLLAATDVVASKLDGTALRGQLHKWSADDVILTAPAGERAVKVKELLELRFPAKQKTESGRVPMVELVDGTVLPIDAYTVKRGTARIGLERPGDRKDQEITAPAKSVAAVQLKPLQGESVSHWEDVRSQNFPSDVLVVQKRDGKSLDYVEGIVGDITNEKVTFQIDGQSLDVDSAKVAGIIYFRRPNTERNGSTEPQCLLRGDNNLNIVAKTVALTDGALHVTTMGGVEFTWPLGDIQVADFSAGKLRFLSDIEPVSERWTPLVALPASLKLASDFGKPRRDQSAYGGPLSLRVAATDTNGEAPNERVFSKGLALRSRTEIAYRLPSGFRRFLAVAGIEPATETRGDVFLSIEGDGRRLLETQVAGDQPPQEIELDIKGLGRLTIIVDYGENLDTGDWLNLCNARIVK